jgi:hypothetical protein
MLQAFSGSPDWRRYDRLRSYPVGLFIVESDVPLYDRWAKMWPFCLTARNLRSFIDDHG